MPEELSSARRRVLAKFVERLVVEPGSKVRVDKECDPSSTAGVRDKEEGQELLDEGVQLLSGYQARLAAQSTWGVLVVLQALDTAGKDGVIRHVMSGVNPQGVSVHSFKVPSAEELSHDYLWRYASRLPARGEIGIFNRSHYEEVLAVRVHREFLDRQKLPPGEKGHGVWERRFREINGWERYLSENGLKIVKLFLNVSREEQRKRLLRRIDLPDHNWKFSHADVAERAFWGDYQDAISEALSHTSTEWAPWHVIPADHKWYARIATASVLVNTLIDLDPRYPRVDEAQRTELLAARQALEAEAPPGALPDPNVLRADE
ncbi:MAG TPA: polyphosphate kinase 2 family protein [Solirubrobacteraceae bacterium]|nr:polyphosphate kinase 2 family protein [Solirubrobacteraceae bacterium]